MNAVWRWRSACWSGTELREHRGDGHVAALVAAGLDGCEALVLRSAVDVPRAELQPHRGWTDQEWDAAAQRLTDRGLLAPDGAATEAGRELLRTAEAATDQAAERPWRPLSPEQVAALVHLLTPLTTACATALRFPNPIGLPKPTR
ncbi:SCO6745 family protein [Streptomyces javensis]|uniref:SCO6745 family protein n=1 Tax=Streptomyces javensis TaxID=114698 RepID=UPI003F4D07F0